MADLLVNLKPFELQNVHLTGKKLGSGAYGSVEEGEIPGAVCAVKTLWGFFRTLPENDLRTAAGKFVQECRLMSTLRHPNIVQFLGICYPQGSRLPALVMERLTTSLHDLLETRPGVPLSLKHSFLYDVARGLVYLHSQSSPIIHRDLSAKNILLNSAMVAKIADLGMTRVMSSAKAAYMSAGPGAAVYMPPEVAGDRAKYDITIDVFSLGVVAIFTLTQCFPGNVLPSIYRDKHQKTRVRSELERREEYMQKIYSQFPPPHPFVQMIKQCLHTFPEDRPKIQEVVQLLERAKATANDAECVMDRLTLIQTVKELSAQYLKLQHQLELEHSARHDMEMHTKVLEQQKAGLQEENVALKKRVDDLSVELHEQRENYSDLKQTWELANQHFIVAQDHLKQRIRQQEQVIQQASTSSPTVEIGDKSLAQASSNETVQKYRRSLSTQHQLTVRIPASHRSHSWSDLHVISSGEEPVLKIDSPENERQLVEFEEGDREMARLRMENSKIKAAVMRECKAKEELRHMIEEAKVQFMTQIETFQSDTLSLSQKLEQLKEQYSQAQSELAQLSEERASLVGELQSVWEDYESLTVLQREEAQQYADKLAEEKKAREKLESTMAGLQSVLETLQGSKEMVEEKFGSEVTILREQLLTEQGKKEKLELSLTRQLEAARKEIDALQDWVQKEKLMREEALAARSSVEEKSRQLLEEQHKRLEREVASRQAAEQRVRELQWQVTSQPNTSQEIQTSF